MEGHGTEDRAGCVDEDFYVRFGGEHSAAVELDGVEGAVLGVCDGEVARGGAFEVDVEKARGGGCWRRCCGDCGGRCLGFGRGLLLMMMIH